MNDQDKIQTLQIAVLLPCYNEEVSIRKTVENFRATLPDALVYVYDNRSTDRTAEEARLAGAIVRREEWPGKGNVVRRMFSDVQADIYLMADGDGTYDHRVAPKMIQKMVDDNLDMVIGIRQNIYQNAYRPGHGVGNQIFNTLYRSLFGRMFTDIFSGYRLFSRRFVKSFPAISSGFEIETEISVHASQLRLPIAELPTHYTARQDGSLSKLRTVSDGFRILFTLITLFKEIRPMQFFGLLAIGFCSLGIILSVPLFITFIETGHVPRLPTAVLSTGMVLMSGVFLVSGLILDSLARGRLEQKRMWYLASNDQRR
jgi:glycosyltransferase involved in cell wall biosynthesis